MRSRTLASVLLGARETPRPAKRDGDETCGAAAQVGILSMSHIPRCGTLSRARAAHEKTVREAGDRPYRSDRVAGRHLREGQRLVRGAGPDRQLTSGPHHKPTTSRPCARIPGVAGSPGPLEDDHE